MFPRGHLSGEDEAHESEPIPLSPKTRVLQDPQKKKSQLPSVEQSMCKNLQKCLQRQEDNPFCDKSLVNRTITKANLTTSEKDRNSDSHHGSGVVKDSVPRRLERIRNEESKEKMGDEEAEHNNVVEHILKELKGINKIQEEISDLRQYLTSVRGSVDEVSCCVDAVISEIGELYSGASSVNHPSPDSQPRHTRRGSLGRQNAISSPHVRDPSPLLDHKDYGRDSGYASSHRSPKQWCDDQTTRRSVHQMDQEYSEQSSEMHLPDLCYLELHGGHNYQSTSSLSSCQSSNCPEAGFLPGDTEYDRWPSVDIQHSISGERGWSEEDLSSCANSGEELENFLGVWNRCATEDTQGSTSGHSSHNSSEHLSLLFGSHYDSPSSSSSQVDWRPLRQQAEGENLECDCAVNCPFSRSSGYHTTDACANEHESGPSRSLSCSTVLLTDCDDGCLEHHSPCDDCPSSGDTLDLGSVESLDREWTDNSISREDMGEILSVESSEIDSDNAPKTADVGFDATSFSKAVLTVRSALKGAFKKLEGSNTEDEKDDSETEASPPLVIETSEPEDEQSSISYTERKVSLTENYPQFATPKEESESSVYMDCLEIHETLSGSLQASPHKASPSPGTQTEYHSVEVSQGKGESTDEEMSNFDLTPDHCPARQGESPMGPVRNPDEMRLSPIKENHILNEDNQGRLTDAGHRERIENFRRILREKRQTHHRLSRSAQGSHGSHGSQGSQGSQSQDEFISGIFQ